MTRVAVVQTNPHFGEVKRNVGRALELMSTVKADLYVLPELFSTGYNFINRDEVEQLAEPVEGSTVLSLQRFAEQHSCHIIFGFAEKADTLYNSAAVVGQSGMVGMYRKVHLFDRENLFFSPGNLGFRVFDLPFGKVGIMICFDWIYPESARSLALQGAQLIAHPSNLVLPHCPDAMVTRCLENRVFAATADRVGRENRAGIDLTYKGMSELVSPHGEILKRLSVDREEIAVVEVDLNVANNKKLNPHNDLFKQRRTDQYTT
jgi:predicted amidohydrolase